MSERVVSGRVIFPPEAQSVEAAAVRVQVLDVSLADAPSSVAGEVVLHHVSIPPGGSSLEFSVPVEPQEAASYTVWVHVDVQGDGQLRPGDLVSTGSHPVLTRGQPERVDGPVRLIP